MQHLGAGIGNFSECCVEILRKFLEFYCSDGQPEKRRPSSRRVELIDRFGVPQHGQPNRRRKGLRQQFELFFR